MPQLGPENKLGFNNVTCWLLGHDVDGKVIAKSRRRGSGEMADCQQQYCRRCQNPDSFPIGQFPDRRNLYRRTIPVWVEQIQNRWRFSDFGEDWECGKKDFHLYLLDEQLKKYGPQKPRT